MSSTIPPPHHASETIADRKKSRELAEARQSGQVAPEVDVKTGSMINPHNPEFITKRPWYLGEDAGPSLDHQAAMLPEQKVDFTLTEAEHLLLEERKAQQDARRRNQFQVGMWVEALKQNRKKPYRICQVVKIAKNGTEFDLKFEDGTMERKVKNKGNRIRMTKMGNRSSTSIVSKESYDSKRDKYHGFDHEGHMKRMEQTYQQREDLRREKRSTLEKDTDDKDPETTATTTAADKVSKKKGHDSDSDYDDSDVGSDDSEDEFVQRDEDAKTFTSRLARQGGVGGAQMKVTARNLRIREDTAKYLRNLDPNSAYYDPKSRSMRDNPNPDVSAEELQYAGDNFTRISGDAVGLADTQLFAWEASDQGVGEIHPQANPSQAELLKKQFRTKSADIRAERKKAVLDKYGGAEYLDGTDGLASAASEHKNNGEDGDGNNPSSSKTPTAAETIAERKVRFGVSVTAEEYTRDGRLIKGGVAAKRVALKSKYDEDVFLNGHSTVWGSYFHIGAFRWGYADDHSLLRNSYCTGENGRRANDEANEMRFGTGVAGSAALAQAREMLKSIPLADRNASSGGNAVKPILSKLYGEADQNATYDQEKVREALQKVDQSRQEAADDRKRKFNSLTAEVDVTEEEMEAYRMRKGRGSDPMANLASTNEILDYK